MVNMHYSKFGNKWAEISKAMANGRTGIQGETNNANAASKHTTCAASSTAALHTLFLRTSWVHDVIPAPILTLF